jgi:RNA polymerase sigma-70 factor (ECF subfamily)
MRVAALATSETKNSVPTSLFDTLPAAALRWEAQPAPANERNTLDQALTLDRFLTSVEKRAFRIARVAVRQDDDALDIVQDAMLQLARRYAQRPSEEWRPLFYRILHNRIRDCQRRRKVRAAVMAWLPWRANESPEVDPIDAVPDTAPPPIQQVMTGEALQILEQALAALPPRQQQAFMLRNFEELDVAETAAAMGCSAGSVKTHYSRAVHALRERLGEAW